MKSAITAIIVVIIVNVILYLCSDGNPLETVCTGLSILYGFSLYENIENEKQ